MDYSPYFLCCLLNLYIKEEQIKSLNRFIRLVSIMFRTSLIHFTQLIVRVYLLKSLFCFLLYPFPKKLLFLFAQGSDINRLAALDTPKSIIPKDNLSSFLFY